MPAVVVVGSINMDLVVRAPRHPAPGETILGTDFATFPGGKGANQAVAAARMGGQVRMVGRVGEDVFGESLLGTLRADGVDTRFVTVTPQTPSGVALITVADSGQNNIVVVPGANGKLTPADVRAAEAAFLDAAVVVAQLEIPVETVFAAAQMAKEHGAKFVLNPAPARALSPQLLSLIDYMIPNQQELALLTHRQTAPLTMDDQPMLGPATLIVTLGDEGALVVAGSESHRIRPHTVQVVDTTAAGDAFVGAFAAALAEGKPVLDAAVWGNGAGALAVTGAGAQPSLPTRSRLESFLADEASV